jgi:ABC-2 type transport system ATP-binding protein
MPLIEVRDLCKDYTVIKKDKGLKGAFKNLIHKQKETLHAVNHISFTIDRGEIVGYIGPNGAGKSTTVKMLSGILSPTSGEILIGGLSPQRERKKVVQNLGVVFGQRSQLNWDLRLDETFELLKRIYQIDEKTYRNNLDMMDEILEMHKFINTPVRQLSLGQRMRGDLVAAMLHSPEILFLDEPTIGLDVDAKQAIRKFIKEINRMKKTTVILTTHDLGDIQELCSRIIIINEGVIIEDGSLTELIDRIAPFRYLHVDLYEDMELNDHPLAKKIQQEGARATFRFEKGLITAAQLIQDISQNVHIKDVSLEEAKIEDIIQIAYHSSEWQLDKENSEAYSPSSSD